MANGAAKDALSEDFSLDGKARDTIRTSVGTARDSVVVLAASA
jgi:hypothetical protein